MVKVKDLFLNRNQFALEEIAAVSQCMYDAFYFKNENWQQSLEVRIAMLKGYIEVIKQLLFSDLIQNDSKKLMLVDTLDKLVAQKDLFELSLKNQDEVKDLTKSAEQFGKKTMFAIGV